MQNDDVSQDPVFASLIASVVFSHVLVQSLTFCEPKKRAYDGMKGSEARSVRTSHSATPTLPHGSSAALQRLVAAAAGSDMGAVQRLGAAAAGSDVGRASYWHMLPSSDPADRAAWTCHGPTTC